ncbi:MAG TPA: peptidase M23, partial [Thermovirga lienii]|nr:peptidase M23 [Thermovirga lienii]
MSKRISHVALLLLITFLLLLPLMGITQKAVFAGSSAIADLDTSIKAEEQRLERIKKQISYHERQVIQASKREKNILKDLSQIGQKIVLLEQQIRLLNLREERTQMKIEELTKEISKTNGNIDKGKEIVARRLVALYKYGNVAQFNLILSASNVHEVLNNVFILKRISEQDERYILGLLDSSRRLEESKKELENQKALLAKQKAELEAKRRA